MNPRIKPMVAALALLSAYEASAQTPELPQVMVTATRQATRVSEVLADVTVIDREELAGSGQTTVAELLARQPGVEFSANGGPGMTTNVYLRGGANNKHTLVLIDGQRVSSATTADFAWSRLSLDQVERIEILRGSASSLYGSEAIGGVVQIFTRQGDGPMRFNAEIGAGRYQTQSASAGVSGAKDGWRYSLQASNYDTRGYNVMTNRQNLNYGDRDGYNNQSVTGSLAYAFNKDHSLAFNAFHSDGDNRYDSTSTTQSTVSKDYKSDQVVSSYQLTSNNRLSDVWSSTLRIGRSLDLLRSTTNGTLSSRFNTIQDQLSWQNDLSTWAGTFLVALERLEQKISTSSAYSRSSRDNDSALLGWSGSAGANSWQANVRRDENSQFGAKNTGNLSYGYRFSPAWRVHASYGTAFRAPAMSDLYYPLTGGVVGNPNLRPETARNREASLVYQGAGSQLSLTLFSNQINDLISWSGRNSPVNIGSAKLVGQTLSYGASLGGHEVLASYTHQRAVDADTGNRIARRAAGFGSISVGRRMAQWDVRAEVQGAGKRFDTDLNTRTLGGYAVLNLSANYTVTKDWSVFARLNNVLDKKYELAGDFATPGASVFVGLRYAPK